MSDLVIAMSSIISNIFSSSLLTMMKSLKILTIKQSIDVYLLYTLENILIFIGQLEFATTNAD